MISPPNTKQRLIDYVKHHARPQVSLKNWLNASHLKQTYRRKLRVASQGQVIPVYLIQANRSMFLPGADAAYYCLVLFTFDPLRMEDRVYMTNLAAVVASLKNTQPPDAESQYVAAMTTDERAVLDRRRPLPPSFTPGMVVYVADLILYRVRLYGGYLMSGQDLVCMAEPGESGAIDQVPWWIAAGWPEQAVGEPLVRLQPGESLIWEGRPDPAAFVLATVGPAVGWATLVLAAMVMTFLSIAAAVNVATVISGLMFAVLLPLFIGYGLYRDRTKIARATRYVVTNLRIAIQYIDVVRGTGRSRLAKVEVVLNSVEPRLRVERNGIGTIQLGVDKLALSNIPDAADVYQAILVAKPSQAGAVSESRTGGPPDGPGVPLRLGEQLYWSGKPDAATYVRTESVIAAIFALPAIGVLTYLLRALIPASWPLWPVIGAVVCTTFMMIVWLNQRGAASPTYYVTDQRVIIRREKFRRSVTTDRELRETQAMKLLRRGGGFGTLVLEKHREWRWHGHFFTVVSDEFTFHAIPDADGVAQLVASLRDRIRSA